MENGSDYKETLEIQKGPGPLLFGIRRRKLVAGVLTLGLSAEFLFLVLDYHVNYGELISISAVRRLCNLAREDGLASWFGTTQTLLVALTVWAIYAVFRGRGGAPWRRRGWALLAALFTYMAADDGAMIHERMGTAFRVLSDKPDAPSLLERAVQFFPSYTWQLVLGPLFALVGLFLLVFLWRELRSVRLRFWVIVALGLFVVAVGLDFVEGLSEAHRYNPYRLLAERYDLEPFTTSRFGARPFDTLRHFSKAIEETLEMLAMTVLWAVFLAHLTASERQIDLRFLPLEEDRVANR